MIGHGHRFNFDSLTHNRFSTATMAQIFTSPLVNLIGAVVPACAIVYIIIDRLPPPRWLSEKSQLIGLKSPAQVTALECPYAYIRAIYGQHHWAPFVHKIAPTLKYDAPGKYQMVLEIMDAIHLCLMLVDDVSRSSTARLRPFYLCLLYSQPFIFLTQPNPPDLRRQ